MFTQKNIPAKTRSMRFFPSLFFIFLMVSSVGLFNGCGRDEPPGVDPENLSWQEIKENAAGGEVTMMMWKGDPLINRYMEEFVIPEVKERFNIDLNIVSGQGSQIVSTLMAETQSGQSRSQLDMMWINGETFYQLRQIDALYGPFTEQLPNADYVNFDNPFIGYDFQQPVDGYEAPWGNVQFTLIYNEKMVVDPPQTLGEFERWVQNHPGKFTLPVEFAGLTLLKSWMLSLPDSPEVFYGEFNEKIYQRYSNELWDRLNAMKTDFWRSGETFPSSLARQHQLFSNSEVAFTMSNNDSEVDNKIAQGVFPEHSRGYVPESGTIQNSHYLGISKRSAHKEEAMVVINFLLSPEAQYQKMIPEVWGDGTVLAKDKLPDKWKKKFEELPGREKAPDRNAIQERAFMEPDPEYMIRLFDDFRENVIEAE